MLRIARILRDYTQAGSVNSLLAPWGFVDDRTFLTKSGHVGVLYRVQGVDYEGLPSADLQSLVHRFEAALRLLDERCRLYQYFVKRTVDPLAPSACGQPVARQAIQRRVDPLNAGRQNLYEIELYLALVHEPFVARDASTRLRGFWARPGQSLRHWLGTAETLTLLETELDRSVTALHQKAQGLEVQLAEFGLQRLSKAESFRFLRRLVNYDPTTVDAAALGNGEIRLHPDRQVDQARTFARARAGAFNQHSRRVPGHLDAARPVICVPCRRTQRSAASAMYRSQQFRQQVAPAEERLMPGDVIGVHDGRPGQSSGQRLCESRFAGSSATVHRDDPGSPHGLADGGRHSLNQA